MRRLLCLAIILGLTGASTLGCREKIRLKVKVRTADAGLTTTATAAR